MKILKNALAYALVLAVAIGACGCDASASLDTSLAAQGSREPAAPAAIDDFDAFMDETLADLVNGDSVGLYMTFEHPEALGIEGDGMDLGVPTPEEWEKNAADSDALLERLEAVDASSLDKADADAFEVILDAVRRDNALSDYYYQVCSPLGIDSGPAALGTFIAHAPYVDAEGFERMFRLYQTLRTQFEEMAALEKERQELGYGLSQAEIDLTIEEYEKLIAGDPPAAATLMNEAIDRADFLDEARKEELKAQNEEATRAYLVPAYEYLIGEMRALKGREGSVGTASMPDGKEYYAARLRAMGLDMSPEELLSYLEEKYDEYLDEIAALIRVADSDALEEALSGAGASGAGDGSAQETVAYLRESMRQDFPSVADFEYEVVETPEALKAPGVVAYYVTRALDAAPGEASAIYVNSADGLASYSTLAHESFPGHMYQDAYAQAQERPYARRYLEALYSAAVEGWGVYSEMVASAYAQTDPAVARVVALDELLGNIIYAYADIGVNYLGWDPEEMAARVEERMGVNLDSESAYDLITARSGLWVPYAVGATLLLDYREKAENALGGEFSATEFHRAVLDVLPASMAAVEDAVDEYVETVKNAPRLDSPLEAA